MIGNPSKGSGGTILLVALMTIVLSALVHIAGVQTGIFVYAGGGWAIRGWNLMYCYLGGSIFFFVAALFGYTVFFVLLRGQIRQSSLRSGERNPGQGDDFASGDAGEALAKIAGKVRYYNAGLELFITIFFAIGVLFTAWGMQNALVSALGGLGKAEAGQLGAWGILQRLVENGILIALWTTIVGGAGGYFMRMVKFLFLGQELNRFAARVQAADREPVLSALEAIRAQVARFETVNLREPVQEVEHVGTD